MTTGEERLPFRGWVASLSDGRTALEGQQGPGEKTPWQKLRQNCQQNGVWITQLRLQLATPAGFCNLIGLPGKLCRGYCHVGRTQANITLGTQTNFRGIGSVVGDQVFMVWVNLDDGHVIPEVLPLEDMAIHCVMKGD